MIPMPTADIAAPEGRPYHHGDLPNALKAAAAELIVERGPAGFSLREVARRAGVSHAAPAHHFGDSTGLLTALAADGFRELSDRLAEASAGAPDPAARFEAVARAYVTVALSHPAHYAVMFRPDLVDTDNPACREGGDEAYGHLVATLEAVRDGLNPALDVVVASDLAWATVHGLVELHPRMAALAEGHGRELASAGDLAAQFARTLLAGLAGPAGGAAGGGVSRS